MSKPYDATLKDLVESCPADWVSFLGRPGPPERVRLVDADLSSVTASADKVIRVDDDEPWLLHLEIQSSGDSDLERRLLKYHGLLRERHSVPVATVVLLLRENSGETKLTGRMVLSAPIGPRGEFGYSVIEVRKQPPERFLNAGLGLLPLAPIAAVESTGLPAIIEAMKRRLDAEATRPFRAQIWADSYILMGLQYASEFVHELLEGVIGMEESTTYQEILRRGRKEGKAEGKAEGAAQLLLTQGRARFHGPPPARIESAVNSITDLDRLQQLGLRLFEVNSWDDLLTTT